MLTKDELLMVHGGNIWTAAFFNTAIRGFNLLYTLGQSVGSAIYRTIHHNYC